MAKATERINRWDVCWFLAWLALSSAWCVTAARHTGATFDEPTHIQCGLDCWRNHTHKPLMRLGAMPLPYDVQMLPLYLAEEWRGQRWDVNADFDKLLPAARAMNLIFWVILLAYGGLLARDLAGRWAGRLAVALLACEPTLLGLASIAGSDLSVTALVLVTVYHYRRGRESGWGWRVGVPAVCYGLALMAKASALAFVPLCMLAVEIERLARGQGAWRERLGRVWAGRGPFLRDGIQTGLLGLAVLFVLCGSDWQRERTFVEWAASLPEGGMKPTMVWLADNLRIFTNAGEGLVQQIKHNIRGHGGSYILGESYHRAVWWYFPVLSSIKLPLALFAVLLFVVVRRPSALANAAIACAAVLALFSLNCRVQIGIRLVMPGVCLGIVGLAAAVATAAATEVPRWRPRWAAVAGLGVGWMAAASASVWPHGLCYVNEAWAGVPTYHLVSDANFDWGQGYHDLRRWQRRHPSADVALWYFGTDPRVRALPVRELTEQDPSVLLAKARGRYLAVSATLAYGYHGAAYIREMAEVLRGRQPVDRAGTFLIYDFTDPDNLH